MEIIKKYLEIYNKKVRNEIQKDSFKSIKLYEIELDEQNNILRFYNKYDGLCYCIVKLENKMQVLKRIKKEIKNI